MLIWQLGTRIIVLISKSVDLTIRNMTQVLPARVRALVTILISKSVVCLIRSMTKVPPATVRDQITICIRKNVDV